MASWQAQAVKQFRFACRPAVIASERFVRGSSTSEANLNYHTLTRDFLDSLCDRTTDPVYCAARAAQGEPSGQRPE